MTPSSHWQQRAIPADYRTVIFCVLVGISSGLPLGLADPFQLWGYYQAPAWTDTALFCTYNGALLLLPVWSVVFVRRQPLLCWAGLLVFAVVFAISYQHHFHRF